MKRKVVDKESQKAVSILLLEDDDGHAKAFTRAFARANIENPITRVVNGVEAFDVLKGENGRTAISSPYMIISDVNMPRMDGVEFVTKVREDPDFKNAVIFMLSTSKHKSDVMFSYVNHVAGYICKDSVGEDFVNLINLMSRYWQIVDLPE